MKSKREKQISCSITYMWSLEKWYRWIYLQSRNGVTDVQDKLMVPKGGKSGMNWEMWTDLYTLVHIKSITIENLLYIRGNSTQSNSTSIKRKRNKWHRWTSLWNGNSTMDIEEGIWKEMEWDVRKGGDWERNGVGWG